MRGRMRGNPSVILDLRRQPCHSWSTESFPSNLEQVQWRKWLHLDWQVIQVRIICIAPSCHFTSWCTYRFNSIAISGTLKTISKIKEIWILWQWKIPSGKEMQNSRQGYAMQNFRNSLWQCHFLGMFSKHSSSDDVVLWREHSWQRPRPSADTRSPHLKMQIISWVVKGLSPLFISPLSWRNSGLLISGLYSNILLSSRSQLAGQRAGLGFRAIGLWPQPLSLSLPGALQEHWQTGVWTYPEIFKRTHTKCCYSKIHLLSQC